MHQDRYQLIGLIGFIVSGLIFIVDGLRHGDLVTVSASSIWTLSCIVWMIPLLRK